MPMPRKALQPPLLALVHRRRPLLGGGGARNKDVRQHGAGLGAGQEETHPALVQADRHRAAEIIEHHAVDLAEQGAHGHVQRIAAGAPHQRPALAPWRHPDRPQHLVQHMAGDQRHRAARHQIGQRHHQRRAGAPGRQRHHRAVQQRRHGRQARIEVEAVACAKTGTKIIGKALADQRQQQQQENQGGLAADERQRQQTAGQQRGAEDQLGAQREADQLRRGGPVAADLAQQKGRQAVIADHAQQAAHRHPEHQQAELLGPQAARRHRQRQHARQQPHASR